jgi:teichuronic acid biosynthesis glycosyltransferase TuaG
MPQISVITPSYNSKKFISETLNSIQSQSLQDFEAIIIDDASPDNSADFISDILPDKRFRLIRLRQNIGAAEARNVGLRSARGRYIAFLDADDVWHPDKLERQLRFMDQRKAAFSFTAYDVVDAKGRSVRGRIAVPCTINKEQYLGNTIIGCLTVIIDRSKFSQDILMPNLRSSHDMALWVNLLSECGIAHGLNEVLASYRIVSTSNTANKTKAALDVWNLYRRYLRYSLFSSMIFFFKYAYNAAKKRMLGLSDGL